MYTEAAQIDPKNFDALYKRALVLLELRPQCGTAVHKSSRRLSCILRVSARAADLFSTDLDLLFLTV